MNFNYVLFLIFVWYTITARKRADGLNNRRSSWTPGKNVLIRDIAIIYRNYRLEDILYTHKNIPTAK